MVNTPRGTPKVGAKGTPQAGPKGTPKAGPKGTPKVGAKDTPKTGPKGTPKNVSTPGKPVQTPVGAKNTPKNVKTPGKLGQTPSGPKNTPKNGKTPGKGQTPNVQKSPKDISEKTPKGVLQKIGKENVVGMKKGSQTPQPQKGQKTPNTGNKKQIKTPKSAPPGDPKRKKLEEEMDEEISDDDFEVSYFPFVM